MHTQIKDLVPGFEKEIDAELRKKQEAEAKQMFLRGKKEVDFRQKLLDEAIEAHGKAVSEYGRLLAIDIDDIKIPVTSCLSDSFTYTKFVPMLPSLGSIMS